MDTKQPEWGQNGRGQRVEYGTRSSCRGSLGKVAFTREYIKGGGLAKLEDPYSAQLPLGDSLKPGSPG